MNLTFSVCPDASLLELVEMHGPLSNPVYTFNGHELVSISQGSSLTAVVYSESIVELTDRVVRESLSHFDTVLHVVGVSFGEASGKNYTTSNLSELSWVPTEVSTVRGIYTKHANSKSLLATLQTGLYRIRDKGDRDQMSKAIADYLTGARSRIPKTGVGSVDNILSSSIGDDFREVCSELARRQDDMSVTVESVAASKEIPPFEVIYILTKAKIPYRRQH